jgi:protease-4
VTQVPPPPGAPPQQSAPGWYREPRDGKPASFWVAIFLFLLLLVSGGLNVLLLVFGVLGTATSAALGGGPIEEDSGNWELVAVGGDADTKDRILRIPITGAIAEEKSAMLGGRGGTVTYVRKALAFAEREKKTLKGVLLAVDSPGGGVTDSDEIWLLIKEFKKKNGVPVHAVFGDLAASGGYYVAVACDKITARATTITGSIGVIMSVFNAAEAAKKLGIEQVTIVSPHTPHKDMLSPLKPVRPEDKAILERIVEEMYQRFVDVVAQGRPKLTREQVVSLADGRVYSASQALEKGLIDAIGNERDALAALHEAISIKGAQVVELRRHPTLMEMLTGASAKVPSADAALAHLLSERSGPRLLYYWQGGR